MSNFIKNSETKIEKNFKLSFQRGKTGFVFFLIDDHVIFRANQFFLINLRHYVFWEGLSQ